MTNSGETGDLRQLLKRRKIDSDMNFQMVKLKRDSGINKEDQKMCHALIENVSDLFRGAGQAESYIDRVAKMDRTAMVMHNRLHERPIDTLNRLLPQTKPILAPKASPKGPQLPEGLHSPSLDRACDPKTKTQRYL